uniref:Uncharacterized protein n=1 Tax=Anguilla anguilla TaxID=7936 RepID=A0A0E9VCF4_ANGAN
MNDSFIKYHKIRSSSDTKVSGPGLDFRSNQISSINILS